METNEKIKAMLENKIQTSKSQIIKIPDLVCLERPKTLMSTLRVHTCTSLVHQTHTNLANIQTKVLKEFLYSNLLVKQSQISSKSGPTQSEIVSKSGPPLCANDFEDLGTKTILIFTTEAHHSTKQDIIIF